MSLNESKWVEMSQNESQSDIMSNFETYWVNISKMSQSQDATKWAEMSHNDKLCQIKSK